MHKKIAIVGAGWSGAAAARRLRLAGVPVEVFEKGSGPGGHAREAVLNGVIYEPSGPHIFHTSDKETAQFVQQLGLSRRYRHLPKTLVHIEDTPHLLSWPLQLAEISALPIWDKVRRELERLPASVSDANFEDYAVSTVGPTLYEHFIYHYTIKQWGREPRELSSSFAPRRIGIRRGGRPDLFEDSWVFFPASGIIPVFDRMLEDITVHYGETITLERVNAELAGDFAAVITTADLDAFTGSNRQLAWRGIRNEVDYHADLAEDENHQAAYVINRPGPEVSYTRTVETKHATGQSVSGSVVCREYAGAYGKHYPVPTPGRDYEHMNEELKRFAEQNSALPLLFCGRLANYQYINQDEAIRQGLDAANLAISALRRGRGGRSLAADGGTGKSVP